MDKVIFKNDAICVRQSNDGDSIHIQAKDIFTDKINNMFITRDEFKEIAKEVV